MNTKVLAIYYPQFHELEENNLAWGKGFTDWNNVKKAVPLFKGHYQPRIPLHQNYYDLSDSSVLREQVKEAKTYGIDGFCFYHYWFDGHKVLHKPLEDFLNDKSLDMEFSLSWANETWTKRWVGDSKTIILHQKHISDEKIWTDHFYYLLQFFKDKRYIRIDDKPIFTIYQPNLIKDLDKMLLLWHSLAAQEGLKGIYFIATKRHNLLTSKIDFFEAILKFQPQEVYNRESYQERGLAYRVFLNKLRFLPERVIDFFHFYKQKLEGHKKFDSFKIWEEVHRDAHQKVKGFTGKVLESAFVNWDNTPRYGKKATIFSHVEPKEFKDNFSNLLKSAIANQAPFVVINAWNEWAEGAYLEPDSKYGLSYLEAIKAAKEDCFNM